ncbi:MAG: serine/threonine-protein kinase [Kofleriaceae bacterium]
MGTSEEMGTNEGVSTGGMQRDDHADPSDLKTGQMVGEYQIEGLLGEGGMGRVYSATHPVIAKRAAIKILHPELSVNREAVERFIQEARSVNQIGHPNIVDIFAFGTLADGRSYFVMEWMRGKSLRDRLRESGISMGDTLSIIETISIALEAAHEKGIVHRDLKPDNIFLVDVKGTLPTVKLLDFGIAKLLGNDSDRIEKTRTGNLLGTPAYISPEQARGQHVDHRTDIYALGALMYEMLTGALVFPAESAADMIAKHLYENPPDARIKNPNVAPQLANLMIGMLAKDVNRRPTLEQVRQVIGPLRMSPAAGPPGGYPPMYTPSPPMQTPHTANQFLTPAPQTYQTGAVPHASVMQSHVVGTQMNLDVPATKSRLPIIVAVLLLVGGAGGAAIVAMSGGEKTEKKEPAVADPVKVEPTTNGSAVGTGTTGTGTTGTEAGTTGTGTTATGTGTTATGTGTTGTTTTGTGDVGSPDGTTDGKTVTNGKTATDGKTGKTGGDGKTGKTGRDGKTGKTGRDGKTGKTGKTGPVDDPDAPM